MKPLKEELSTPAQTSDQWGKLIDGVEDIRRDNNSLWMDILRVAFNADPERTKDILERINVNDSFITSLLKKLAKNEHSGN